MLGVWWAEGCLESEGGAGAALTTPTLHPMQVQTFHGDLLQHMEKNTKLDMQFIKVSLALQGWGATCPHSTDGHTEACPQVMPHSRLGPMAQVS